MWAMVRLFARILNRAAVVIAITLASGLWAGLSAAAGDLPLESLRLPAGFEINLYARVPNARSMAIGPKGTLFVGSLGAGRVYAVPPPERGAAASKPIVIASGLTMPNGVALRSGALYIAEISRIRGSMTSNPT